MRKIAVLSLTDPFASPRRGGKDDIRTRILALSALPDTAVDLYLVRNPDDTPSGARPPVRNVYSFPIDRIRPWQLLSGFPVSARRRYLGDMVEELEKHVYDTVIYEGEYMAPYRLAGITNARRHLLRMHNLESDYRKAVADSSRSLPFKAAQMIERFLYLRMERRLPGLFDRMLFISEDECEQAKSSAPDYADRFIYMPTAVEPIAGKTAEGGTTTILYFGEAELPNNFAAVSRFAKEVFPLVRRKRDDAVFRICGHISPAKAKTLEKLCDGIEIRGYVSDLDAEIRSAALVTVPVFHGAGVKVKLITALARGQIVCATTKAVEGTGLTGGTHLFVSDDPENTAKFCLDVLNDRRRFLSLAENGLTFVRDRHSVAKQAEILESVI